MGSGSPRLLGGTPGPEGGGGLGAVAVVAVVIVAASVEVDGVAVSFTGTGAFGPEGSISPVVSFWPPSAPSCSSSASENSSTPNISSSPSLLPLSSLLGWSEWPLSGASSSGCESSPPIVSASSSHLVSGLRGGVQETLDPGAGTAVPVNLAFFKSLSGGYGAGQVHPTIRCCSIGSIGPGGTRAGDPRGLIIPGSFLGHPQLTALAMLLLSLSGLAPSGAGITRVDSGSCQGRRALDARPDLRFRGWDSRNTAMRSLEAIPTCCQGDESLAPVGPRTECTSPTARGSVPPEKGLRGIWWSNRSTLVCRSLWGRGSPGPSAMRVVIWFGENSSSWAHSCSATPHR